MGTRRWVASHRGQFSFNNYKAARSETFLAEQPNIGTWASLLRNCGKVKALSDGRLMHAHIKIQGLDGNTFLGNCLVDMYGSCGSVQDALAVFERLPNPNVYTWNILIKTYGRNGIVEGACNVFGKMPHRDVVSWNAMLAAYVQNGHDKEALNLFHLMLSEGIKPAKITFVLSLDACANTAAYDWGLTIHASVVEMGYEEDVVVGTALVNMYGTYGNLQCAKHVFGKLHYRDVVSWNAFISAFVQNGHSDEAFDLFHEMQLQGIKPNKVSFVCILDTCSSLEIGQIVHAAIVECEYENDIIIGNSLLSMYGKGKSLQEAKSTFDQMPGRDVISWNAMIAAYSQNGHGKKALDLFYQMELEGVKGDKITFVCAVDACALLSALEDGQKLHAAIMDMGYEDDVVVGTALVNMYGKCGSIQNAQNVFSRIPHQDIISWNAMIAAFSLNEKVKEALDIFRQMHCVGVKPDKISFVCFLDACASLAALQEGQEIHRAIVDDGYGQDIDVGNALICMYGKCGNYRDARSVFGSMPHHNLTSWNAIIEVSFQDDDCKEALKFFSGMQLEGIVPDSITLVFAVNACANLAALEVGHEIHYLVVDNGYDGSVVMGTSLVNMYGKCGSVHDARCVFSGMHELDIVSWNAMIAALAQNEHGKEALDLFHEMQLESVNPNNVTFVCILDACASLAALEKGHIIHSLIIENGYEEDLIIGNAVVNMYGKCGILQDARSAFDRQSSRDVFSWNAMIAASAQNGHTDWHLQLFYQMQLEGIRPDRVTFVCVLTACSHTGQVDEGRHLFALIERDFRHLFALIERDYGIIPTQDIYGSMVDLLGRAGHLDEAEDMINRMPSEKADVAWSCLLGACKLHGDVNRGIRAAKHCFELGPKNVAPLTTLTNILAAAGRWKEIAEVWEAQEH